MTSTGSPQHTNILKGVFLLCIFGAGAYGLLLMYEAASPNSASGLTKAQEYAVRVSEMARFITPTVTIDGTPHTLVERTVRDTTGSRAATSTALSYLRTAEYVIRTRLDPIMALPGSDLAQLETAARALAEYTETLTPYYTEEEMRHLTQTLHPAAFLHTLPELEQARRALLSDPSPAAVTTYDDALAASLSAYRTYLHNLEITLYKAETTERERAREADRPIEEYTSYTFPGGSSSLSRLLEAVSELRRHTLHHAHTREMRMSCFRGAIGACPPLSDALLTLTHNSLAATGRCAARCHRAKSGFGRCSLTHSNIALHSLTTPEPCGSFSLMRTPAAEAVPRHTL